LIAVAFGRASGSTAGLAALGGSVYFLLDKLAILGILGGVVVVLVAGVGFMKSSAIAAKQKELDNLPKEPDPATLAANAAPNRDLLNRLERLKLPANAEELEKLADQYEGAQVADQMVNLWKETEKRMQALSDKCASELESALYGKVAGYVSNLEEAVAVYQDECAERSRLAAMAGPRVGRTRVSQSLGVCAYARRRALSIGTSCSHSPLSCRACLMEPLNDYPAIDHTRARVRGRSERAG